MTVHRCFGATEVSPVGPNRSTDPIEQLGVWLSERGHPDSTRRLYRRAVEHFRTWLIEAGKSLTAINEERINRFLFGHLPICRCPHPSAKGVKTARAALHHLLRIVVDSQDSETNSGSPTPLEQELIRFAEYLQRICGLSAATGTYRIRYVREFLEATWAEQPMNGGNLSAAELMKYVSERVQGCKPGSAQVISSSVRSYLKWLQFQGLIDGQLIHGIPRIPHWKLSEIPRTLSSDQLQRFLASFDRSTATGQRDYAMALCMVELGMRASEVATLDVHDLDWRQVSLKIAAGKSRRERILPIPPPCGRALVSYLRSGRPDTTASRVFVRHSVPIGVTLSPELVRGAMRRGYARAGLPEHWTGTHLLRHTAATRMHQRGVPLKQVADVLGHRSLDTTLLYTKINRAALRTVALPWPEADS